MHIVQRLQSVLDMPCATADVGMVELESLLSSLLKALRRRDLVGLR